MFNFYVVLAAHDKVSDAGRATTYRQKLKAPSLQKKYKKKDLPKAWVLTGKQIEDFRRKKEQKHYSRPFKKPVEHTAPKNNNW